MTQFSNLLISVKKTLIKLWHVFFESVKHICEWKDSSVKK